MFGNLDSRETYRKVMTLLCAIAARLTLHSLLEDFLQALSRPALAASHSPKPARAVDSHRDPTSQHTFTVDSCCQAFLPTMRNYLMTLPLLAQLMTHIDDSLHEPCNFCLFAVAETLKSSAHGQMRYSGVGRVTRRQHARRLCTAVDGRR